MKRLIYYITIFFVFITVCLLGALLCSVLGVRGNLLMIGIAALAFGAAKAIAALLRSKLNLS